MKTTSFERLEQKRINKLRKLAHGLGIYSMAERISNGNESLKDVDEVLKRIADKGLCPSVIDAVKRKQ